MPYARQEWHLNAIDEALASLASASRNLEKTWVHTIAILNLLYMGQEAAKKALTTSGVYARIDADAAGRTFGGLILPTSPMPAYGKDAYYDAHVAERTVGKPLREARDFIASL